MLTPTRDPNYTTPSFMDEIMNAPISRKFKMLIIKVYDGIGNIVNHVRSFSNELLLNSSLVL